LAFRRLRSLLGRDPARDRGDLLVGQLCAYGSGKAARERGLALPPTPAVAGAIYFLLQPRPHRREGRQQRGRAALLHEVAGGPSRQRDREEGTGTGSRERARSRERTCRREPARRAASSGSEACEANRHDRRPVL